MRDERVALKDWLRETREASEMSQADAAVMLGVSVKTINNLENHKEGFSNGLTILRYLRLLEVLPDVPAEPPGLGRLARLENRVEQTRLLVVEGFGLQDRAHELEAELSPPQEDHPPQAETP